MASRCIDQLIHMNRDMKSRVDGTVYKYEDLRRIETTKTIILEFPVPDPNTREINQRGFENYKTAAGRSLMLWRKKQTCPSKGPDMDYTLAGLVISSNLLSKRARDGLPVFELVIDKTYVHHNGATFGTRLVPADRFSGNQRCRRDAKRFLGFKNTGRVTQSIVTVERAQ